MSGFRIGPAILTPARLDALRLMAEGERMARAAHRLGISESALKVRLADARDALGARTTAAAVWRATSRGLLAPEQERAGA